jgi:exopolyphosphatase/guanosine-5'-triphosphate,3'-diphosphate pyrophosphatase
VNQAPTQLKDGELLAAVDLGSNSFHLVVARCEHGEPRVLDRLRDNVRLAAGLAGDGSLDPDYRARALASLARFGQRIAGFPATRVRAAATIAVRRLARPQGFRAEAEAALGHAVEVVSGREEGRLIFLGVAHDLPASTQQRLVVDVGGGSTEFIIGRALEPLATASVQVGCVASTLHFFPHGKLTARRWQQARDEIGVLLQQFTEDFRATGWQDAYASSGTARAIGAVLQALQLSDDGISAEALGRLRDVLLQQGDVAAIQLPGLAEERAPVIAGGVVIFESIFAALGIERLQVCESSMREGVLWDLIGRAEGRDPRTASIDALASRYGVDRAHAQRVEASALALFDQVDADWNLDAEAREWLAWSARVHEVGLAIAHSQHHHHGGYMLRNADLAGFSRQEQQLLAAIVECHRRKPRKAIIGALPPRQQALARRLTALLRLATLLCRARRPEPLPPVRLHAGDAQLRLAVPADWLRQHPLTEADLLQERAPMHALGIGLEMAAN